MPASVPAFSITCAGVTTTVHAQPIIKARRLADGRQFGELDFGNHTALEHFLNAFGLQDSCSVIGSFPQKHNQEFCHIRCSRGSGTRRARRIENRSVYDLDFTINNCMTGGQVRVLQSLHNRPRPRSFPRRQALFNQLVPRQPGCVCGDFACEEESHIGILRHLPQTVSGFEITQLAHDFGAVIAKLSTSSPENAWPAGPHRKQISRVVSQRVM